MRKYIIGSTLVILSMSFKQQPQDTTKTKQDSIRKADLAEKKRQFNNTLRQTPSQKDFSGQFKPDPNKKIQSDYIYDKGRVVGGSSTFKIGKN